MQVGACAARGRPPGGKSVFGVPPLVHKHSSLCCCPKQMRRLSMTPQRRKRFQSEPGGHSLRHLDLREQSCPWKLPLEETNYLSSLRNTRCLQHRPRFPDNRPVTTSTEAVICLQMVTAPRRFFQEPRPAAGRDPGTWSPLRFRAGSSTCETLTSLLHKDARRQAPGVKRGNLQN